MDLSIGVEIVGIDEAQFFNKYLIDVCVNLANSGVRVIVAGLDMDYKSRPFQPIPDLLGVADKATKLKAICIECKDDAAFTHRINRNDDKLILGEKDTYEPLCRMCYLKYIK